VVAYDRCTAAELGSCDDLLNFTYTKPVANGCENRGSTRCGSVIGGERENAKRQCTRAGLKRFGDTSEVGRWRRLRGVTTDRTCRGSNSVARRS